MRRPARPRGFTLVELMVVVALVGVLATLGIALLRDQPRALDIASQLSAKIGESSRKAVAAGAVRGDVLEALGARIPANHARTRVVIDVGVTGGTLSLERLEESPLPASTASWVQLSSSTVHHAVSIRGYRAGASLTEGALAPPTPLAAGSSLQVRCYPDGSCDGLVIYLASDRGTRKARVVVMPLGGSPLTFDGW